MRIKEVEGGRNMRCFYVFARCCVCLLMLVGVSSGVYAHTPASKILLDSLEFKGTLVRDAVRLISEQSGMNIVVTNAASENRVSFHLAKIEAEEALSALCKIVGLWYRKDINSQVYRVMTTDEYVQDVKVFQNYTTKIYTLKYFNARSVVDALSGLYVDRVIASEGSQVELFSVSEAQQSGSSSSRQGEGRSNSDAVAVSPRGASSSDRETPLSYAQLEKLTSYLAGEVEVLTNAAYNEYAGEESLIYLTLSQEHNKVILRASEQQVFDDMEALIEELDIAIPQVLLEMKILSLGVDDSFRSLFNVSFQDDTVGISNDPETVTIDSQGVASLAQRTITLEAKKLLGLGNFPLAGGALTYQYINDRLVSNIELNKTDNDTRLLSAPLVMASNHRPARMFVGEEVVLTRGADRETITPNNGPSRDIITIQTEVREVGTMLEVVPRINQDRTITLAVRQESSSISADQRSIRIGGDTSFEIPLDTIITTELEGTFIAKDGLTVAIGGLFRKNQSLLQSKVPLLGDLPVVGRLFRREVETDSTSELVLLITPHIIYDSSQLAKANYDEVAVRNLVDPRDLLEGQEGGESDSADHLIEDTEK